MDFSFQLYSARNFPPLGDVLKTIAAAGYTQVEGYGGLYEKADELAASLKANGLTMPTGHFGLAQLEDTASALRIAQTLGMKTLYCPFIPKDERSAGNAGWIELGKKLGAIGKTVTGAGYGFGWHNHDFEFHPTTDGQLPMDLILEAAPDIEWEMDVAWVIRGGGDPVSWFERFGNRITALHVKDLAPAGQAANEDGWADVGHGTIDWPAIYAAARARTRATVFVAEHDNPSDVSRFATRSIQSFKSFAE